MSLNQKIMEPTLANGLSLLLIGMGTVFFILSIIVLTGNLLIYFTNKIENPATLTLKENVITQNGKHIAAITSVVMTITEGKGKIDSIKKIENK
jgi:oxaloacetate decarboxylase gamma subunit